MDNRDYEPVDFDRAVLSWVTKSGSHGFWRIIATAALLSPPVTEPFVLAQMVMAGEVYSRALLPRIPAYSFQILASPHRHTILRDFGLAQPPQDTSALNSDTFLALDISTPTRAGRPITENLLDPSGLPNLWPLTARILLHNENGAKWMLEFPINHINSLKSDKGINFQVETGPILVPRASLRVPLAISANEFCLAYAFFNRRDRLDLAVLGPEWRGQRRFGHLASLSKVKIEMFTGKST